MSDLAKILYEKFFMRDLLGKILPGLIVTLSVLSILEVKDFASIVPIKEIQPLLWLLALAWGILAGLALQIAGELIGLHSASPRPKWLLFFPVSWLCERFRNSKKQRCWPWLENFANANEDFQERLVKIINAAEDKWGAKAKEQRERFVYLKEGSGNLSLALNVLFIFLLVTGKPFWPIPLTVLVVSIILYASHLIHAKRQAGFEIKALEKMELLTSIEANAMRKRIGLPHSAEMETQTTSS